MTEVVCALLSILAAWYVVSPIFSHTEIGFSNDDSSIESNKILDRLTEIELEYKAGNLEADVYKSFKYELLEKLSKLER